MVRAQLGTSPPGYAEQEYTVKVLDVNDNTPVFAVEDPTQEMEIFVDRYSPQGTIVAKVRK